MPVNVTDKIIILEQDQAKLSQAIHTAVIAVLDKYRLSFIPGVETIPAGGTKFEVGASLSEYEKKRFRTSVRLCQVLEHYRSQTLGREFLSALETYVLQPNGKGKVPYVNVAVREELQRAHEFNSGKDPMRFVARMIFLTLATMRVLLLPMFSVPSFIPERAFGPEGRECLIDLLHPPLRELLLTLKPRPERPTSIDWTITARSKATNGLADVGSDYLDWKPEHVKGLTTLRGYALSVGPATTWHDITDVTQDEINKVYCRALKAKMGCRSFKLYLNCLYLCRKSDAARDAFFEAVYNIPNCRIYTLEYKIWAQRRSYRGKDARKEVGNPRSQRHSFLEDRLRMLASAYIQGKENDETFVAALAKVPNRKLILDFDKFSPNGPIASEYGFDWQVKMGQWKGAFALFRELKNYESERGSLSPFPPFFIYLGVYLPAWSLRNPESEIVFPEKIVDFRGSVFVHRPDSIPIPNVDNPPITFKKFNDIYNKNNSQETISNCVRVVSDFFEEIIPSCELLGIPQNWSNPVRNSAIPTRGKQRWGCTKADIPVPVSFLTLLYCYRILDCMYKVNEALLGEENEVLSNRLNRYMYGSQGTTTSAKYLRDISKLTGFNIDTSAIFDGKKLNFDVMPKRFFTPRKFPIKGRGQIYLLDTGPLEQIIVMFETGLRGQSVQWLDTKFDIHITAKTIDEHGIYPLRVNTDKVKNCAWSAYVAGRVINVLRERRKFREMLDDDIYEQEIYYEGNQNSKWGKFKPLFSINVENGFPHNDTTYSEAFKLICFSVQTYIDKLGLNCILSIPDATSKCGFKADATPHSTRKVVIRQHITYLPAEYIGKYITGQTPRAVAYYAAFNPDSFSQVENHQNTFLVIDGARRVVDTSRGPEITEPHKPSSAVARAFTANIKQAMHDFGPMSTAIFDQESTGSDILLEGRHQKLAFEATHICPFGAECPPERQQQGLVRRCNFCDFALRTVDHVPAIASEMRNLSEECNEIDIRLDRSGERMSIAQRGVLEKRRREISEDLFGLMVAEYVLRESLKHLKDEYRKDPEYFCFTPEVIIKNLEAAPFPRRDEGLKYVLSRLKEAKTYVSLNDRTIKANIAKFARTFMSRSDDLSGLFKDEDLDQTAADVYSFVHNFLSTHNLTLDQMVIELRKDIGEVAGPGTVGRVLLPGIGSLVAGSDDIGMSA